MLHTSLPRTVLVTLFSFAVVMAYAQKLRPLPNVNPEWSKTTEPFRIAGDLYYVGTYDLACYLITTPKGNILINTGLAESVPVIKANIEALGFKFNDIKILLNTQAHYDHVAGMAEIKKRTGAKMMINEQDAQVLADGGESDFVFGGKGSTFIGVKADRLLHDSDSITLGGTTLIALHHPGHTKGSTSFLVNTKDDKRAWKVLIVNMPTILEDTKLSGMPTYPNVGKDYAYTLGAMKKLQFDLWVASHASQFDLHDKRKAGDPYNPQAFSNRADYDSQVSELEAEYQRRLKGEK
jgi:metallo-beta-lactamase class B